jgi:hypothetical protein
MTAPSYSFHTTRWTHVRWQRADQAALAEPLGITPGNFRVMLTRFRKRYSDLFREAVADTLNSPTDEEVEQEIRELIRLGTR